MQVDTTACAPSVRKTKPHQYYSPRRRCQDHLVQHDSCCAMSPPPTLFKHWSARFTQTVSQTALLRDSLTSTSKRVDRIDPWPRVYCIARPVALLTPIGNNCKNTFACSLNFICHLLATPSPPPPKLPYAQSVISAACARHCARDHPIDECIHHGSGKGRRSF